VPVKSQTAVAHLPIAHHRSLQSLPQYYTPVQTEKNSMAVLAEMAEIDQQLMSN
jgi:hypothetical protein